MKLSAIVFLSVLSAAAVFADGQPAPGAAADAKPAAAEAKPKAGGMRAKTGGSILRPIPEGSKAIVFLNALGNGAESAAFAAYAKRLEYMTSLYVKNVTGDVAGYDNKAGDVVIAIVKEGDLAILPAKRMAVVPVCVTDEETAKNLWKATVAVFSLTGEAPNDFTGSALIRNAADAIGIPQVQRVFYKKALEEGWAPEPKDEFQKKLWDEFKARKDAKAAEAPKADEKPAEAPAK